jgi:serine/threonine-protein kinase HipA
VNKLDVRLQWGPSETLPVGTLARVERRGIFFEFSPEFLTTRFELSPWKLAAVPGLVEHRDRSFGPIFGVFDDSLPDGWGLLLMDRRLRRAGRDPARVSVLDRLALLGARTMGALTYHPPADEADEPSLLDLDELAHQAEEVLSGTADEVLPELERAGGSPGGARPKVVVGVKGSQVMTGDVDLPEGFEHWLVKFSAKADLARNGPVEHAYMRMAEAAGITVPPTRLFTRARHFGVRRFDRRPGNRRLHMHTFGNMIHSDFRVPSVDYDTLLRVTGALTRDQRAVEETFRRMVFNLAAHNRDDHVKNFAFLMDEHGEWTLSPAYDLCFSHGPGGEHTMTVAGEGREPGRDHCLRLASTHGISPARAAELIDEVRSAVTRWPEWAAASHVAKRRTQEIAREHARPLLQLVRRR